MIYNYGRAESIGNVKKTLKVHDLLYFFMLMKAITNKTLFRIQKNIDNRYFQLQISKSIQYK